MSKHASKPRTMKKRLVVIFLLIASFVISFLYASGKIGEQDVSAQQFIDLQENGQAHFGFRRAHAKGICLEGEFESNGLLSEYSTAEFFQRGTHPFIGRHSIAGGNPIAPDLGAPVRSLALSFSSESGQRWRTGMNTSPVMAVSTPEAFYRQIQVLTPDPITGKPKLAQIKAFFADHPESKTFNQWKDSYTPTTSFATEKYHSINAFYLIDEDGDSHAVRWVMVPQASAKLMTKSISKSDPDALQLELTQRLENDAVRFDMMVSFAHSDDDENDPTIAWPTDRKTINAGTVIIRSVESEASGSCNGILFNPLILPQGMAATADPILNARGGAYAESYRRRARETFLRQKDGAPQ